MTLLIKDANQATQPISTQPDAAANFAPVHVPASMVGNVATPVSTANPLPMQVAGPAPNLYRVNSAAGTNATNIKAAAGSLLGWLLSNAASAPRYVRVFNISGVPTVGTTTPLFTVVLPANSNPFAFFSPVSIPMNSGIAFDITTGNGDADTGATSANDVTGTVFWL